MGNAQKQHRTTGRHVHATSSNVFGHLSLNDLFDENDVLFGQVGLHQLNGAGVSIAHGPEVCETPLGIGEPVVSEVCETPHGSGESDVSGARVRSEQGLSAFLDSPPSLGSGLKIGDVVSYKDPGDALQLACLVEVLEHTPSVGCQIAQCRMCIKKDHPLQQQCNL